MTERDRAFPFLTGLGVSLGLYTILPIPVPILPVVLAVLLGTARYRHGEIVWLGERHTVAVLGTAGLGLFFGLSLAWIFFSPYPGTPVVAAFIGLPGGLSCWFGFGFQRWAERDLGMRRGSESRWDVRS